MVCYLVPDEEKAAEMMEYGEEYENFNEEAAYIEEHRRIDVGKFEIQLTCYKV